MPKIKYQFKDAEEALKYYTKRADDLSAKYNKNPRDFWIEAEEASISTDDYREIRNILRAIQMASYLISKEKNKSHMDDNE